MPRYFFDLAPSPPVDAEGEELPDDAAAMEAARQTVLEMVLDGPPDRAGERIVVSNKAGELVRKVHLEEYAPEEARSCNGNLGQRNRNGTAAFYV